LPDARVAFPGVQRCPNPVYVYNRRTVVSRYDSRGESPEEADRKEGGQVRQGEDAGASAGGAVRVPRGVQTLLHPQGGRLPAGVTGGETLANLNRRQVYTA